MFQQELEPIIKDLSKKYKLPSEVIRQITRSPFLLAADSMRHSNIDTRVMFNTRIPFLGMFYVKPTRLDYYVKREKKYTYEARLKARNNSDSRTEDDI